MVPSQKSRFLLGRCLLLQCCWVKPCQLGLLNVFPLSISISTSTILIEIPTLSPRGLPHPSNSPSTLTATTTLLSVLYNAVSMTSQNPNPILLASCLKHFSSCVGLIKQRPESFRVVLGLTCHLLYLPGLITSPTCSLAL